VVDQSWPPPHASGWLLAGQYTSGQSRSFPQYPASNGSHAHVPSAVKRVPVGHATAQVFSVSHAAESAIVAATARAVRARFN
jgi:hypothetical protein